MKFTNFTKPTAFTYEQFEKLREAMCYLSQKQRDVLYMRFWDNMSIQEISRHIGQSWKSTDTLIDSAVNHLRIRILYPALSDENDLQAEILQFRTIAATA